MLNSSHTRTICGEPLMRSCALAVHTYLELFARYFVGLTPNVALIAAVSADPDGNLAALEFRLRP